MTGRGAGLCSGNNIAGGRIPAFGRGGAFRRGRGFHNAAVPFDMEARLERIEQALEALTTD